MTWTRVIGSLIERPDRTPATGLERRMLDAIISEPDDDGPRNVYADWLGARAEPELVARGELIVVQCALEQMGDPAEHNRLKTRDFELVERYGNLWCAQVGLGEVRNNWYDSRLDVEFRRGFIESVSMWLGDFPRVAAGLFAAEPVRHLVMFGIVPDVLARLPRSIYMRRLSSLALRQNDLRPAALASIVSGDHVSGLVRLAIEDNPLGYAGVEELARSRLDGLRELSLLGCQIDRAAIVSLIASQLGARLEVLELARNPIDDTAALDLAELPNLRRLSLDHDALRETTRERLRARFG